MCICAVNYLSIEAWTYKIHWPFTDTQQTLLLPRKKSQKYKPLILLLKSGRFNCSWLIKMVTDEVLTPQFIGLFGCRRLRFEVYIGVTASSWNFVWVLQPQLGGLYRCCRHSL